MVHKESISDGDWARLTDYFAELLDTKDPRKLTAHVWFHVTSKCCLHCGELQCKLTKSDVVLSKIDGKYVFCLGTDFLSKNHQSGISGSSKITAGVIQDEVQVAAIKLYMSKLNPDSDHIFQRASVSAGCTITHPDAVRYIRSPISHNLLSSMMKCLSLQAKLSKVYTNHCLRATTIVYLNEAGVDDRRICEISGHRNTAYLASYDRLSAHQAVSLSAAIAFKHVPETSAAICHSDAAHAFSKATEPPASHYAFTLNAAGATFKMSPSMSLGKEDEEATLYTAEEDNIEKLEMTKQLSNED